MGKKGARALIKIKLVAMAYPSTDRSKTPTKDSTRVASQQEDDASISFHIPWEIFIMSWSLMGDNSLKCLAPNS